MYFQTFSIELKLLNSYVQYYYNRHFNFNFKTKYVSTLYTTYIPKICLNMENINVIRI